MRERKIVYKDDDYDVEIVVRQATLEAGFSRYALQSRERARLKAKDADDSFMVQWAAIRTLPDCVSGTVEITNKGTKELSTEMDLEGFMLLPEALVVLWEHAIYECNPHWLPQPKDDEQGEASEPSDNSSLTEDLSLGSNEKSPKTNQNGTSPT